MALDTADVKYAESVLGEAEAKWMRRQQIAARAARVLREDEAVRQLPPIGAETPHDSEQKAPETAEDWISLYWDNASLVSDDMLQELYARILASEAVRPGSCSRRTLGVLRHLDRETADRFAKLVPGIFNNTWIPRDDALQKAFGITYDLLLDLDDARLVDSNPMVENTITGDQWFTIYGTFILGTRNSIGLRVDNFLLTRAGRELARVAQVPRSKESFLSVAEWLLRRKPDMVMSWAEMPHFGWSGKLETLEWHLLELPKPAPTPAPPSVDLNDGSATQSGE